MSPPDRDTRIPIPYPYVPPPTKASEHFFLNDPFETGVLSDAVRNSTDGSHLLFSIYVEGAMEADRKLMDNWAKDAEIIMLLGGLISATVSTFLSQVYFAAPPDNSPAPEDISISAVALGNLAIFCWFLCLGSSLTSVVVANLVQGWTRRYTAMTQPQRRTDNCARIRAYVLHQKPMHTFQLAVDFMRLLSDISIFSFLVGLIVLTAASNTPDYRSLGAIMLGPFPLVVLYGRFTLNSFRHSYSVFTTPMSNVLVALLRLLSGCLSRIWAMICRTQTPDPGHVIVRNWLMLDHAAHLTEKLVKSDSLTLDREILGTILHSINQGDELERLLASIPSFYHSAHVQDPAQVFRPFSNILSNGIVSFIYHTLSSQTLPHETKQDRIQLSLQVMDVDPYLLQRTFFYALTLATQPIIFQCVDFVLVADRSADSEDWKTQLLAKCIIAVALSHSKDHQPDPRLSHVFGRWLNSATFANTYRWRRATMKMINLVRLAQVLRLIGHARWVEIFDEVLLAVARFEGVESAADEYKMEFCILWNQLLNAAVAGDGSSASHILPHIYHVYTALHGGTAPNNPFTYDSIPARYTECTIPTHYFTPRPASPSSLQIARGSGEAHTLRRRSSLPSYVGWPAV